MESEPPGRVPAAVADLHEQPQGTAPNRTLAEDFRADSAQIPRSPEALMTRSCCLCGARRGLRRYRAAEIRGGPAQWRCLDEHSCADRLTR